VNPEMAILLGSWIVGFSVGLLAEYEFRQMWHHRLDATPRRLSTPTDFFDASRYDEEGQVHRLRGFRRLAAAGVLFLGPWILVGVF
jgi:hypothetical protein